MLQGADDAEAVEASGSSVPTRIWGPVRAAHTNAIGAPAAVASVLLRPSSETANLVKRMEALVPEDLLPTSLIGQVVKVVEVERTNSGTSAPGDLAGAISPKDKASWPPLVTILDSEIGEAEDPKRIQPTSPVN